MKPIILFKRDAPYIKDELAGDFEMFDYVPADGVPGADVLAKAKVLVTSGIEGASAEEMDAMPDLGLICTVGTGYEGVDVAAAKARGIQVTHAASVNAPAVADHVFALLLGAVRAIPTYHASASSGNWRHGIATRPMAAGKRMGIVGMGSIGLEVARRAVGFDMAVAYMSRREKDDLPWPFLADINELAEWADYLVISVPGGAETHHMINRGVLKALGPDGYVVSVGRGSVVKTDDLIAAIRAGEVAGAGIDVYENEPDIPEGLRDLPNVVLTPHVAGTANETRVIAAKLMRGNIEAYLAGERPASLVPELAAELGNG